MQIKLISLTLAVLFGINALAASAAEAQCQQEFNAKKTALGAHYGPRLNTKVKDPAVQAEYQAQIAQAQSKLNMCLNSPAVKEEKAAAAKAEADKRAAEEAAAAAAAATKAAEEEAARALAAANKAKCLKNCPKDPTKRAACQARC
jgi:colicin import membrane protein